MSEIASAFVTIAPSARGFGSSLNKQVGPAATSAGKAAGAGLGKAMLKGFLAIGVLTKATQFLGDSLAEAREAQKVSAQTGAVLKSTGKIAGVSAGQIGKLATALSNKIGVDDEAIQAGENMLLTFTNVRNEVGKGNDIFTQATRTVQDMAAAFGGDATSNSKILGKALNDPVKGVSALTRVGVSFTDAQKEQIKTLVESGNSLKAQKIILGELTKETKGSAEAQVTASDKARVALGNLEETIGTALLPVVDDLATFFTTKVAPAVTGFVTGMQDGTGAGGQFRDVLGDIGSTAKDILSFLNGLPGPVKQFGAEAAIAALLVPKLTGAIQGVTSAVGLSTGKLTGWRKGLLLATGVGGIATMTEGAKRGNKAVSLFGDALTGAFVGGTLGSAIPIIGTAIGAAGGAAVGTAVGLFRMHKGADAAGDSSKSATPKIDGLADSLNQTTAAATRATKALILQKLQEDGVVASAGQLGIATSDLIKASLGNDKAIGRVNDAWTKQGDLLGGLQNQKVSDWIYGMRLQYDKAKKSVKDANAALDGTDRSARKAAGALRLPGKDRPQTDKWTALYQGDINKATRFTSQQAEDMRGLLSGTPGKARANMAPFGSDLAHQLAGIKGRAHTAGLGIGNAIQAGVSGGLSGIAQMAAHAVAAAVAAAQAAAHGGGGGGGGGHGGHGNQRSSGGLGVLVGGTKDQIAAAYGIAAKANADGVDKVGKKLKERLTKLRDSLASVRSDFASLVEPVASNFTQGLFDFDTAGAFTANLATVKGTLTTLLGNFKTLVGEGLSPGFLYRLFQEGGPGLIAGLAGLDKASALAAGGLFGEVTSLSDQLGTQEAGATDKGAALETQTARLEKAIKEQTKAQDANTQRVVEALTKPAAHARRRARLAA